MTPRARISLDGTWGFAEDDHHLGIEQRWYERDDVFTQKITVPGCWQAQGNYCHTGWYHRTFRVPDDWRSRQIWLKFGGVSYETDVWVNGQPVMRHENLFLPFHQDISHQVLFGAENTVVVRAKQFSYPNLFQTEQLGDKLLGVYGCWTEWGGIYQPVALEAVAATYIDNLFLIPDIDNDTVVAQVRIRSIATDTRNLRLTVMVHPRDGGDTFQQTSSFALESRSEITVRVPVSLRHVTLWDVDLPFLYEAIVTLLENGRAIDTVTECFGMRKIEVRGKHILLNNRPIFLRGWLDDAIFPETISPTITKDHAHEILSKCKAYGFNFVRHHTHMPVPVFHQVADELGVLQVEEFASFGSIGRPRIDPSQQTRRAIFETWRGMIERDRNHPSLIGYGMTNECWTDYELRYWAPMYRDLYAMGKQLDPTRIIIDNSGGENHWSIASDVYDKHLYQFPTEQEMLRASQGRTYRAYIPKREAYYNVDLSTVNKPCLVTEVGGWCSFPDFERIRARNNGEIPWWLSQNMILNPKMGKSIANRIEAGMAEVADLYPQIVLNSERYQAMGNKLQIEHMRQTPGIAGYAYCTFNDCYNWTAGIVDNYWQPKSSADSFAKVNQPSILLWLRERWCFYAGERIDIKLAISHYDHTPIADARINWCLLEGETIIAEGCQPSLDVPCYTVHDFAPFSLVLPALSRAARCVFKVTLTDEHHSLSNEWNVWVFPKLSAADAEGTTFLYDPDSRHSKWLEHFPFIKRVDESDIASARTLITTHVTEPVIHCLEAGNRVLWLESGRELNCRPYSIEPIVDYQATIVNDHPITRAFPHDGWCDMQFHHLIGTAALDTGYFLGMIPIIEAFHVPYLVDHPRILPFRRKGLLAEAQVGAGRLIATTFVFDRLNEYAEVDAMAEALLAYLLSPISKDAHALTPDDLREWAWGSVHGEQAVDCVPFLW